MGKNWDYSKLSHDASLHGGPEKYLELIKDTSLRKGRLEGKAEGKAEVLIAEGIAFGIGLLGYAGYKAFTAIKDKHEKETIEKQESEVREAEKELIDGMNKILEEHFEEDNAEDDE